MRPFAGTLNCTRGGARSESASVQEEVKRVLFAATDMIQPDTVYIFTAVAAARDIMVHKAGCIIVADSRCRIFRGCVRYDVMSSAKAISLCVMDWTVLEWYGKVSNVRLILGGLYDCLL